MKKNKLNAFEGIVLFLLMSLTIIAFIGLTAIIIIGKQIMAQKFNEWMAKIGNIYYADDNRMAKAFKIIDEYEEV